jgi:hypothetical protein
VVCNIINDFSGRSYWTTTFPGISVSPKQSQSWCESSVGKSHTVVTDIFFGLLRLRARDSILAGLDLQDLGTILAGAALP